MIIYDAGTGSMCFASALVSLKKGGLVRRSSWAPLMWVSLEAGRNLIIRLPNGKHERWARPMGDLLAEDWQEALVPFGVER